MHTTTNLPRVFFAARLLPANAAKLRARAKVAHKGNVSAAANAIIAESKTGREAPATGRHPARPRTSLRQHAAK